jgi:hypothetical protein
MVVLPIPVEAWFEEGFVALLAVKRGLLHT